MQNSDFWLILVGLLAGFIDSIAGGGGLITVPVLSLVVGPGPLAIGTNKVTAVVASGAALIIYLRGGHVSLKGNRRFAAFVAIGAFFGAFLARYIPPDTYRWIIVTLAPGILWIVFRKDIWVQKALSHHEPPPSQIILWVSGFGCGLYDGVAGPGGGTLMFLSLLLIARLPLLQSMATAKVANLASAAVALGTFASSGHVLWKTGLFVAGGIGVGAMIGASLATHRAAAFARTALLVVATLLILRLVFIS